MNEHIVALVGFAFCMVVGLVCGWLLRTLFFIRGQEYSFDEMGKFVYENGLRVRRDPLGRAWYITIFHRWNLLEGRTKETTQLTWEQVLETCKLP